ncbi:MAG: capsule assembly Wzi family protein [Chlorobiales bacterium]
MKNIATFFKPLAVVSLLWLSALDLLAQVETVPLEADFHAQNIYEFLKEMRVKKILRDYRDDVLTLSRAEIIKYLKAIESRWSDLSETEKKLTKRFQRTIENPEDHANDYTYFLGTLDSSPDHFPDMFSDKEKLLFYARDDENRLWIETFGELDFTQDEKQRNAFIAQGGFRFRGTLLEYLGYTLTFIKGATLGNRQTMLLTRPDFLYNFKYLENIDGTPSIDFTDGYLRYQYEPKEDVMIFAQLGREKIRYGLGYSASLTLSGNHQDLDAIRFGINYKRISLTSIHASTSGNFLDTLGRMVPRTERYTKYFSAQRLRILVPDWFAIGIGVVTVYHGRFDLAYLNPFQFYKFAEHSLQDRDNVAMFFDIQTHFLKNIEFQASFFLDENLDFTNLNSERNKYAFQVGVFWYEFLTLKNLSFIAEYTRVRPYTYTHFDSRNSYSAWGVGLGHPIGANADEVYLKLAYNPTDWIRPSIEFRKRRKGNNIVDENGVLIRNVGGDLLRPYETFQVDPIAPFLDGDRVHSNILAFNLRVEPVRNWVFEIRAVHYQMQFISQNRTASENFFTLRLSAEY